jgi:hypothetical protein
MEGDMNSRQRFSLALIFALAMLFGLTSFVFAQTSSCVKCHTDEASLKALYQPPKMDESEGAG